MGNLVGIYKEDDILLFDVGTELEKHVLIAFGLHQSRLDDEIFGTGLKIEKLLSGTHGGEQQIASRIAYNEIDMLLYFKDTRPNMDEDEVEKEILRLCDMYNIPVATNIATAEVLITALDRGDLDWRELLNPRNRAKRKG